MRLLPEQIDKFRDEWFFLSNMSYAPMIYEDIPYLNSESAYQSAKTTDMDVRRQFMNLRGAEAKHKGKAIQLRDNWGLIREQVMYDIVLAKFTQNPHLATKLIDTRDVPLIEGNEWRDTYWGVYGGKGQNKLGKILMKVREELQ